jgi:hypothetical protein
MPKKETCGLCHSPHVVLLRGDYWLCDSCLSEMLDERNEYEKKYHDLIQSSTDIIIMLSKQLEWLKDA